MNPISFRLFSLTRAAVMSLILFSGFLFSCEKDPEPLTTNSCISGRVYIDDATIGEIPEVKITAIGPYGSLTTTSDGEGEFLFRNVGNGTYELECSRAGYGSNKVYSVQVFGSDTAMIWFETMYPLPDRYLRLPNLTGIVFDEYNNMIISTDAVEGNSDAGVRFYIGFESDVSNKNYYYTDLCMLNYLGQYYVELQYSDIESGTQAFLVGYISNIRDEGYLDEYRNIKVHPTVNEDSKSEVISFIMP